MSKTEVPSGVISRGLHQTPVNRQAAQVLSPGTHWDWQGPKDNRLTFTDCPPLRMDPVPDQKAWIGRAFGRLTIVGIAREQNKKKNMRVVVRCKCGLYEVLRTKAMVRGTLDCCARCERVRKMRTWATIMAENAKRIREEGGLNE